MHHILYSKISSFARKGFLLLYFLPASIIAGAQNISVGGKVVNENGAPIPGATVKVKGTSAGISTNDQGEFTLLPVKKDATLVISSIGYEKQELQLNGKSLPAGQAGNLIITLKRKTGELDQAIVIAYGTTTKRLNTGDVSKVTAEEIERQPVSNPLAALEGRVPGLLVTQSNGVPGSSFNVQIMGQNSIAQGSDPLFIIDGVPYAPNNNPVNELSSAAATYSGTGLSPFNSINPSDIESIQVLKDADATAIYGSRGANGAILITTKKGKAGKTEVSINAYSGFSRITRKTAMLNTTQYLQMRQGGFKNDGITPDVNNAPDLLTWDTTRYTNFPGLLIGNTAHTTDVQASISGGSSNTQFLFSGGYHHETTVFPGDFADNRGSFHVNIHHDSKDQKFGTSFSATYVSDKNQINSIDITQYINTLPNAPSLYDSKGQLNWQQDGVAFYNPMSYLLSPYTAQTNNLLSNLQLNYHILPGLVIKANTGYNTVRVTEVNTNPINSQDPQYNPQGYSQFGNNFFSSWILEPQAEYVKRIHHLRLDMLIGGTWQQTLNSNASFFAYGYTNDALLQSMTAASSFSVIGNSYSQYHYEAIFGRLNMNWNNKYILNLSARRDGSSRFGPGKQFGNFGAAGAAWLFYEEQPVKQLLRFLSYGKLRLSYGTTGNDQIRDYQYLDSWNSTSYPYNGTAGLYPAHLFNSDYSWEITRKLEAGVELGFFMDKILLTGTYFRNRSSNQLIQYALPLQTGFRSINSNFPATVQNTGWEFTLNSSNISTAHFSWTSSFNLTIPKNKLVAFPGLSTSSYAGTLIMGKPLSVVRGYQCLGVDPATGVFQFEDVNKDGILNSNDYVILGNLDPKFYGGLGNSFSYRSFQLDIFLVFRKQWGKNYLASIYNPYVLPPGTMGNQPTAVLKRWQKPGDITDIQQFTTAPGTAAYNALNNFMASGGIYGDASYLRLKTLSLSYVLSDKWLKNVGISGTRIYLQAQNLLTFTGYQYGDPETQNLYALPPLKTITAGFQLNF